MKKSIDIGILSLLLVLSTFTSFAQSNNIVIGKIDSLQSKILGEQRKIWVYVPDQNPNSIFSPQRYPVLYLLDGDGHFSSVVGMIEQLSTGGNNLCPKMIVVAIPNTDRMRDLTPTHIDVDPPYIDSSSAKTRFQGLYRLNQYSCR